MGGRGGSGRRRDGGGDRDGRRQRLAADNEEDLYRKLPKIVESKLELPPTQAALQDEVRTLMEDLVSATESRAEAVVRSKLEAKVLLLDNVMDAKKPAFGEDDAETTPQHLQHTRKTKPKQGFFELEPEARKYANFEPLHALWKQYMQQILKYDDDRSTPDGMGQALVKADFHGCCITVVKSRRPGLIGQAGIVIQETENTFRIINRANTIKVLPKCDSIFSFELGKYTFTIFGNHFRLKPVDRAARKFKAKASIELLVDLDEFISIVEHLSRSEVDIRREIMQGFKHFDRDGKGYITMDDLVKLCKAVDEYIPREELREMFVLADLDGKGKVTKDEFIKIMLKTNLFR
ncbi:hypothetical protein PTSG_04876 [Salpingoeca rosetta]|uniref:EF-hand domain-containing protein n=1 Tax=Salpingoeca rosetta (strain ATCC 50818 / BSB-021) TaxID=946362 RepID=F2U8V9_SALR5|nr:uncharacterized protein PTSG_04876 [Salpingoeca rosetta]EGD73162.1 hypothetical protein PTSG_04876 [Salpingoeca rosetta]|eukprot:XP_004994193.1 hypothetical protein PTSG_04876 [Salpingoeca rosetta]